MKRSLLLLPLLIAACSQLPSWAGGEKKAVEPPANAADRIPVLQTGAAVQPDASLASISVEIPSADTNADWPQHSNTPATRAGNLALAVTLEKRQSARTGDGNSFHSQLVPPPVVGGGAVFAMDAAGMVSAHDMKDVSEVRWISPGAAGEGAEPVLGGGLAYEAGRVYAASGKGRIVALDAASGREIWRQPLGIPVRSAPRVEGGRVYVVTVDSQLFALDNGTGAVLWSHRGVDEGRGFLVEASPVTAGELVIAPYASGEIHVLHADSGQEVWADGVAGSQRQAAVSVFSGIGGDPVLTEDGILYVAGSSGQTAAFRMETGQRVWEQPLSSINTPWVAGEYLYIITTDSILVCLQRLDGRIKWVTELPAYEDPEEKKGRYSWSGPVMAGGRLLAVGAHGEMLEISPQDGSLLSRTDIAEGVYAPPVAAGGSVYLLTQGATLHALY